jgi:hypothetical protein
MKPLVKTRIPFNEMVALADTLLSKPPEWFEPFLGHVPTFDEITKFVDAQVKERMTDEVWVNDIYQVAVRPADKWGEEHGWPSCIQY